MTAFATAPRSRLASPATLSAIHRLVLAPDGVCKLEIPAGWLHSSDGTQFAIDARARVIMARSVTGSRVGECRDTDARRHCRDLKDELIGGKEEKNLAS
jgi:hypothetical protein